jgi:hypothetical protein
VASQRVLLSNEARESGLPATSTPVCPGVLDGSAREASTVALCRLWLRKNISDELIRRLDAIDSEYDAVHIRNIDYKGNYQFALRQLSNHLYPDDIKTD